MSAKIKLLFYVVCLSILICSCGEKSCYRHEVREVNFLTDNMPTVKGEEIELDAMGCDDIIIYDSLIIVLTNNPAHHIQIFSLNNYKPLANIGPTGRARNEFIYDRPQNRSKQVYEKDGHIIMPVVDYSILKEIDITASIEQQQTVMISAENCLSIQDGNFVLLDNSVDKKFEYRVGEPDEENPEVDFGRFFVLNSEGEKEITVYSKIMEGEGDERYRSMVCHGVLTKHPMKNIVAQKLSYLEYILMFDFDKNKYYALHQQNTRTFDEGTPGSVTTHYVASVPSNNYLMILKRIKDEEFDSVIFVIDWQGNCICSYKLDKHINRMAYDERNNILYGMDYTVDKIYKFNLNGIL